MALFAFKKHPWTGLYKNQIREMWNFEVRKKGVESDIDKDGPLSTLNVLLLSWSWKIVHWYLSTRFIVDLKKHDIELKMKLQNGDVTQADWI